MVSAYNSIYLKVTYTAFLFYDLWSLIDGYPVNDDTSTLIAVVSAVIFLILVT